MSEKTNSKIIDYNNNKDSVERKDINKECDCKTNFGTKKRTVSVSSQIKTTHNKSEIGHKSKKCSLHKKDKSHSVKNANRINEIAGPLAEHIILKTF